MPLREKFRYECDTRECTIRRATRAFFVVGVLFGGIHALPVPALAQVSPSTPNVQQNPATQPPQAGALAVQPSTGGAGQVTAGAGVTPTPGVAPARGSSLSRQFGSAGQGLPGMPGGPPIRGVAGAQDPSSAYMSPPVIGPLFCDPAVDLPC
jgi:hypothetical protein